MANLLSKVFGVSEASSARRPQILEFQGINYNSNQADNLLCFFPMWEAPGTPCLDYGPLGLVGQPTNILRTQDPYFGDVYAGDGVTRGYKIPYNSAINFGLGPSPFSIAFWFQAPAGYNPTLDAYLMTFDDPGQTNFPGFAVSFDTGGTIACNTGNTAAPDNGHKATAGFFDGRWHHLCFSHYPQGANAAGGAINKYYVDGLLNAAYAADANIGAVGSTVPLYIGTDDDGVAQPFGSSDSTHPGACLFCDLRIYNSALGAADAAQIYHPDTRWELYQPARKSFYPLGAPPPSTNYTASFSGSVLTSGAISKFAAKSLTGSTTPAGSLAKQPARALAGSLASAGSLSKTTGKALAGAVTASASLAKSLGRGLSGSVSTAGSLAKSASRGLSGSVSTSGALAKSTLKAFAGSVASSGSLAKRLARSLAGSVTPSGALATARVTLKVFTGSITVAGSLAKSTARSLSGSVSSAGLIAKQTGKALAGSASSAGTIAKRAARSLAGSVTASGLLTTSAVRLLAFAGSIVASGAAVAKSTRKALAGSVSSSGAVAKLTAKGLSGSVSASGALAKLLARSLSGVASAVGAAVGVVKTGGSAASGAAYYFRNFILGRRSR